MIRRGTRVGGGRIPGVAVLVALSLLTSVLVAFQPAGEARALSGSEFDPSYIITDELFFDGAAMSEAQIQAFLDAKIGTCSNTNCLNVKTTDSLSRAADAMCAAYAGAAAERTSTIIYKVQVACGVSAKVILVTLQKEQGLVTNKGPTLAKLERAMGYGCPDNPAMPGFCEPAYGGLANQIYLAARQFKRYGNPPGTANTFTWFPVGRPAAVRFHPNAACGSSTLVIRNKATAALYYYTPYQPNAAALANLGGTGDGCSAYGNRNFWVHYNNWFGSSTLPKGSPAAAVTAAQGIAGGIMIAGWGVDPDAQSQPLRMSFWVDGLWNYQWMADQDFPADSTPFPDSGSNHGFGGTLPAAPGTHTVCVYAFNTNAGVDGAFTCHQVVVPANAVPSGYIQPLQLVPGGVAISGWVVDPDALNQPVEVSIWVDNTKNYRVSAGSSSAAYPALAAQFSGAGGSHGLSQRISLSPGRHKVCFYAVNQNAGADAGLSCSWVNLPTDPSPKGEITTVGASPGLISLSGWAVDPDSLSSSLAMSVWVDGVKNHRSVANASYPEGDVSFPGAGVNHGWATSVPASTGSHSVCVYAVNVNSGSDVLFGCRTVVVTDASPKGAVLTATGGVGTVALTGWAIDPDALSAPLAMSVWVDGARNYRSVANASYPEGDAAFPGAGASHGWATTVPATAGSHSVCVYAVNVNSGSDVLFGCRTVVVDDMSPKGAVLTATGTPGAIELTGWAIDPDALTSAVEVSLWVDGARNYRWPANTSYPDGQIAYPGAGTSHGFAGTLPVSAGTHSVCVYAVNINSGKDVLFGCRSVVVP